MNDITDSELIMLYHEKNEDAEAIIFDRYERLVNLIIKKYEEDLNSLKIDKYYVYGECLSAFSIALEKFVPFMEATFYTYATMIINRKIKKIIVHFCRQKNRILEDSLSLNYEYENNTSFQDYLFDDKNLDPLEYMISMERKKDMELWLQNLLSAAEMQVYILLVNGCNNGIIAKKLGKSYKQIDNTIQRIKNKLKRYKFT